MQAGKLRACVSCRETGVYFLPQALRMSSMYQSARVFCKASGLRVWQIVGGMFGRVEMRMLENAVLSKIRKRAAAL